MTEANHITTPKARLTFDMETRKPDARTGGMVYSFKTKLDRVFPAKPRNRREKRKLVRYAMAFGLPIHEIARATGIKREKLRQIERGHARAVVRTYREHFMDAYLYNSAALGIGAMSRREVEGELFVNPARPVGMSPLLGIGYGGRLVENTAQARMTTPGAPGGDVYREFMDRTLGKIATNLELAGLDAIRGADPYEKARMEAAGWGESPVERMARMGREAYERNK